MAESVTPRTHIDCFPFAGAESFDGECCVCKESIEKGYKVTDDDGYTYCENCWQP